MSAPNREVPAMIGSMLGACVIGAAILGGIYMGTERYAAAARASEEREAIAAMLSLDSTAVVREVSQYLDREHGQVVYRAAREAGDGDRRLVFALDGTLAGATDVAHAAAEEKTCEPLGRIFVASRAGAPAGFVVEGESRGYKNVIRFFVALDSAFAIAGVKIVQHEEDPGLGAETATPWFQGQYVGRRAESLATLEVTRDPCPEDWSAALHALEREPLARWRKEHEALIAREGVNRVYAVTGATISSRAVTDGVRETVDHFRRRWAIVSPHLEGGS